ncbi:leucine-rich repeat and WD repeat-containing protein [Elysia marginata]|uniref:Leucine-rich repeat and WD repeat-containing protein n=1 Tax=Elysia marginata TaxID=1093978 RepID=A0AAV4HYD0_9GAST|nr:leucine-rich repeat and WD repeat-containing protein [Elysia marginata]
MKVLSGSLEDLPPLSSKIVRIFTSSTFTDTTLERNNLMEKVYPRLKDYCREKHGLEFQVVDMRWGVRDEATDDHMTTRLCMQEIENCQRVSMGPNFIVSIA